MPTEQRREGILPLLKEKREVARYATSLLKASDFIES